MNLIIQFLFPSLGIETCCRAVSAVSSVMESVWRGMPDVSMEPVTRSGVTADKGTGERLDKYTQLFPTAWPGIAAYLITV
jgi:hypothetical protein